MQVEDEIPQIHFIDGRQTHAVSQRRLQRLHDLTVFPIQIRLGDRQLAGRQTHGEGMVITAGFVLQLLLRDLTDTSGLLVNIKAYGFIAIG